MNRRRSACGALAIVAGLAGPVSGGAQEVRLAGEPRNDAERAVADFLARGGYEVWARDTVLARDDVVRAHVLVLEASARVSGSIEGDVLVVDGDLFLRTRGRVAGDIVVLGGGFYDSDLAEIGGSVTYRPNERIRVRPTEGDFEVFSVAAEREPFELDGTLGVRLPTYQRVDAVTLGWGAIARFDDVPGRPDLEASVRFLTGPGDVQGSVRNSWYPHERFRFGVQAGRETRTMDGWIRPTWYNSLSLLVADDDAFNYYLGDRVGFETEWRAPEPPIWEDAAEWSVTVGGFWENVGSLAARDTWALFESGDGGGADRHPNPDVAEGDFYALVAGFEWMQRSAAGRAAFGIGLEYGWSGDRSPTGGGPRPGFSRAAASGSPPAAGGAGTTVVQDFRFALIEGRVSARRILRWGHAVDAFGIARVATGRDPPPHRFSALGGPGTIPTLPLRSLYGPELLYLELTYAVPVLGMASLGGLDVFARGSGGSVWGDGLEFDFRGSGSAGIAIRAWEFQMETGVARGSNALEGARTVWFFDVRTRRSARPAQSPRPGRGF